MKILLLAFLLLFPAAPLMCQTKRDGFALYLLPVSVKPQQLHALDISKIKKPAGTPLIAMDDIDHYQKDRYELGIYYTAAQRLNKKALDLRGKIFVVFAGDKPIYTGAFWTDIWSGAFDGFYIDIKDFAGDFPVLKIESGYPRKIVPAGPDPRSDKNLLDAFEAAGKLRQELFIRGKCKAMRNTMKRRASTIYTFTVDSVIKGNYTDPEISFETWADGKGAELLTALSSDGNAYGEKWDFDRNKQILLKFEQRTDLGKQPYWFWFRSFE